MEAREALIHDLSEELSEALSGKRTIRSHIRQMIEVLSSQSSPPSKVMLAKVLMKSLETSLSDLDARIAFLKKRGATA